MLNRSGRISAGGNRHFPAAWNQHERRRVTAKAGFRSIVFKGGSQFDRTVTDRRLDHGNRSYLNGLVLLAIPTVALAATTATLAPPLLSVFRHLL